MKLSRRDSRVHIETPVRIFSLHRIFYHTNSTRKTPTGLSEMDFTGSSNEGAQIPAGRWDFFCAVHADSNQELEYSASFVFNHRTISQELTEAEKKETEVLVRGCQGLRKVLPRLIWYRRRLAESSGSLLRSDHDGRTESCCLEVASLMILRGILGQNSLEVASTEVTKAIDEGVIAIVSRDESSSLPANDNEDSLGTTIRSTIASLFNARGGQPQASGRMRGPTSNEEKAARSSGQWQSAVNSWMTDMRQSSEKETLGWLPKIPKHWEDLEKERFMDRCRGGVFDSEGLELRE